MQALDKSKPVVVFSKKNRLDQSLSPEQAQVEIVTVFGNKAVLIAMPLDNTNKS
jgi:hypothetical protein